MTESEVTAGMEYGPKLYQYYSTKYFKY